MRPNDWAQATTRIVEDDGAVASEAGGLCHVLETDVDGNYDIVNVYFERTGVITIVHREELKYLGGPETGRALP